MEEREKHRPRKRFGQHFLTDQFIIDQIISVIAPQKNDHLVEIGPGTGVLTQPLLSQLDQLDVVELDRDLAENLRRNYDQNKIHVHEIDVLNFSFRSLLRNDKKIRLVGNLPYNISTPLIFHVLEEADVISDMTFMLQKEVAVRMTAEPGSRQFGRLSVMLQYHCETEYLFDVPPEAFDPPPKVMSSIIRLTPKEFPLALKDKAFFGKLVKQAFSQRRKTLRNVLKDFADDDDFENSGLSGSVRSETVSVKSFVDLSNYLHAKQVQPGSI
ncbi:MAG: 16S rRNA (adenine(1518)-N(6)/adenine(1519)-N(6))-dimethyltransferase RsmA [Gammaproteobacteria bacterium]